MKKLYLIILLIVGVSQFSSAQIHPDSLITPTYICQADSFSVTLAGWHGMGGYQLDSLVHSYRNDSLFLKYYFNMDWGPATPTRFRVTHKFPLPQPGNYKLFAKRYDDGYYITYSTAHISVCSGINGLSAKNDQNLEIFPNPTNESLTVKALRGNGSLTLRNVTGKVLIRRQLTVPEFRLDLMPYPPGIYLLTLEDQKGSTVRKIVKN